MRHAIITFNDMKNRTDFALDLKAARRQSGLTQEDCAHLMGCNAAKLTRLERGERLPGIQEMVFLGLIFGRTFENLFAGLLKDCRDVLSKNLETLPEGPKRWSFGSNRQKSLDRIAGDLADHQRQACGSV